MRVGWGGGGSCEIINTTLYAGRQVQCNPSGTMLSLELRPQDDIVPEGYIGHVAQHTGQRVHNVTPQAKDHLLSTWESRDG